MANMIEIKVRIDEAIELIEKEINLWAKIWENRPFGRGLWEHSTEYIEELNRNLDILRESEKKWDYSKILDSYSLLEQKMILCISQ